MSLIFTSTDLGVFNAQVKPQEISQSNGGQHFNALSINAATGNLVMQQRDALLVGKGEEIDLIRTYNSR